MSESCEHKWMHLETIKHTNSESYSYATEYNRTDIYFCEKCLEEKIVRKTKTVSRGSNLPEWY